MKYLNMIVCCALSAMNHPSHMNARFYRSHRECSQTMQQKPNAMTISICLRTEVLTFKHFLQVK